MILNQTSRNKGCCDLKGPWDHFRVFNSCIKKEEEKKKLHEAKRRRGDAKERVDKGKGEGKRKLEQESFENGAFNFWLPTTEAENDTNYRWIVHR